MADVFRKLNLKNHRAITVIGAPPSFEPELGALANVAIRRKLDARAPLNFLIAFVTKQTEVERLSKVVAARAEGDAIVWFAYPKGTSKNYKSAINRDSGWDGLRRAGFEPVRMIAIDADWTAVRFRRVEFIKVMTRKPRPLAAAEADPARR